MSYQPFSVCEAAWLGFLRQTVSLPTGLGQQALYEVEATSPPLEVGVLASDQAFRVLGQLTPPEPRTGPQNDRKKDAMFKDMTAQSSSGVPRGFCRDFLGSCITVGAPKAQ